jgi:hypothetical protein
LVPEGIPHSQLKKELNMGFPRQVGPPPQWIAMGSLQAALSQWPRKQLQSKPTFEDSATPKALSERIDDLTYQGLTMRAKRAALAVAGEALRALLALLFVVFSVLFFYLFYLPWHDQRLQFLSHWSEINPRAILFG